MASPVDPRMQFVGVGDKVHIRRSNRKAFQRAEVVSVTPRYGYVNVEWKDKEGNVWGREVHIAQIIELNPHLVMRASPSYSNTPRQLENESCEEVPSKDHPTVQHNKTDDNKNAWLAEMQARLADARIRGTTLPDLPSNECYFPERIDEENAIRTTNAETDEHTSESGNSLMSDVGETKQTLQIIGRAQNFLKNMLSSPSRDTSDNIPVSEQLSPEPVKQLGSTEQLQYDDQYATKKRQNQGRYVAYKLRTPQDPFYSPVMEEMFGKQAHQCRTKTENQVNIAKTDFDSNEVKRDANFYSYKVSCAIPTRKKTLSSDTRQKKLKPSISIPKTKYKTINFTKSDNSPTSCVRPPTRTENQENVENQSQKKATVVEKIQQMERDRGERRKKQDMQRAEERALRMKDPGNVNWKFALMVNEYREKIFCCPLTMSDSLKQSRIIVCIRKRPLNMKELDAKEIDVITIPTKDMVLVHEPKAKLDLTKYLENHAYKFDYAFDENSTNELVYQFTTKPLIETVFEGGMATVFAYGQTGSGKTHTMGGNFSSGKQDYNNGIYMNVARDIFHMLNLLQYDEADLRLSVTFFEIYKGKVYDLLAGRNEIRVMEDVDQQIQVVGLTEIYTDYLEEVVTLIQRGNSARTSGKTAINPMSSRSHSVLQMILRRGCKEDSKGTIHGKFSLIDLAGNERGVGRGMVVDRRLEIEGAEINKSLLALKECIRALARSEGHIPFRGSKLTLVLKDTFTNANSRVCMIGTVSPGHMSCNCSLNTILYANRVKEFMAHDPVVEEISNNGR